VEMPEMDGLEALGQVRTRFPDTSVVMVSGSNQLAANATITALERGALDFIRKPEGQDAQASRNELRNALRPLLRHVRTRKNLAGGAAGPVTPAKAPRAAAPPLTAARPAALPPARPMPAVGRIEVLGVGVSTGGPNALGEFIPKLPGDFPVPVLLVQHMPRGFTASLAEHLDKRSKLRVREAREGELVEKGSVYIAPGGMHMVVRSKGDSGSGRSLIVGLNENPPENSCRPSVDVLFRSMAAQFEGGILALVMTGMGSDGCEGVRTLKRRGCHCLTQTEESCVVYGMPQAIDEAGLSDERVPLCQLAQRVDQLVRKGRGDG
jgi:two-component system, chemotaxis family, protein-glutamate methylesterase/glutaminase